MPTVDLSKFEVGKDNLFDMLNPSQIRELFKKNKDEPKVKAILKTMTPEDVFILFDTDGSGLINFDEFRYMLPYLEVYISDAKAYRYFKMCDTNGNDEIDIDEFKVALFICDPTQGNTAGFIPTKNVTPLDSFDLFSEHGFLDEDQLYYASEYLNLPLSDWKHENHFRKIDLNHTGSIDYEEFRSIYLLQCDVRRELEDRGVDVPSFAQKKALRLILEEILKEEETKERYAIEEAKRYKKWLLGVREKKRMLRSAYFRAYQELRSALDGTGQTYILGGGQFKQFGQAPNPKLGTNNFNFEYFEKVLELWRDRLKPEAVIERLKIIRRAEEQDEKRDAARKLGGLAGMGARNEKKVIIDPYKEALVSRFKGTTFQVNTAALWGRRIHHVAISENVLFALSDTGEVYTLGGNNYWWHEIQPDSIYQQQWRGDTTARSQLLLGTIGKTLPPDTSVDLNAENMTEEDMLAESIKVVCKYFNCWEPPPNPATRMNFFEKDLLPKLQFDAVKFALEVRGKVIAEQTKVQMVKELHEDILLEKKLLGEKAHKSIRELETQVVGLLKRRKNKLAEKILGRIKEMWDPLREVQAEQRANAIAKKAADQHKAVMDIEKKYDDFRDRIYHKREEAEPEYTPRGNSLQLNLSGVTPRGPTLSTPRNYEAAVQISAGAAHACLVHKSGALYSWGSGAAGRLGLDLTEGGDPQKDTHKPKVVQALLGRPVIRVSCGYSHSAAVVSGGDLFMWGSTATGKCGLGDIVDAQECYCSVPTKIIIGREDRRVRKVSCGSAHTGVVTEGGQLFIFGCGDGGRLGLGRGKYDTVFVPTLVEDLLHEKINSVSCGNTHTIVVTDVKHEWEGHEGAKMRTLVGGRVYVTGSANVLGRQCDTFTFMKSVADNIGPIKMASAGYQHSCAVSAEGELICWGHNKQQCCGDSPLHFIHMDSPSVIDCLYQKAKNIAIGKLAYQSSTFSGREASFAVNGDTSGKGIKHVSCTQQDPQSWLEIDLGSLALIDGIRVWNRADTPKDPVQPTDLYSSRLFPCWVMIGHQPFSKDLTPAALKDNLKQAVAKVRFVDNNRASYWRCPGNTQGRYVRIQLEGYNTLSIAQLEVLGYWGISKGVGRVSYATAGRDITVAVIRASKDPRDIENLYKRAAWSDALNADILRQLETYALEYDKFGRGEVLKDDCLVCEGGSSMCETCLLLDTYKEELTLMPPAVGGRRRRLKSIDGFLTDGIKDPLVLPVIPRKERPTKWDMRKEAMRNWFKSLWSHMPKLKKKNITKELALDADPEDIMRSFMRERPPDESTLATQTTLDKTEDVEGDGGSSAEKKEGDDGFVKPERQIFNKISKKGIERLKAGLSAEDDAPDDDKSAASSIGASVNPTVQQFRKKKPPSRPKLEVGDILPTGQVVKGPFPRSIVDDAEMMKEVKELQKTRAEKEKVLKEKEAEQQAALRGSVVQK